MSNDGAGLIVEHGYNQPPDPWLESWPPLSKEPQINDVRIFLIASSSEKTGQCRFDRPS